MDVNTFKICKIEQGWNCECCGYIYDYNLVCYFDGIEKTFSYDGHFGKGDLHCDWNSPENLDFIVNEFKEQFEKKSIVLVSVKDRQYDENKNIHYSTFELLINGENKTYIYVTDDCNYDRNYENDVDYFSKFFEFIGVKLQLTTEDNNSYDDYDYDDDYE